MKAVKYLLALITISAGIGNYVWSADSAYIAPFWNDKKAAVTYTFDDGLRDQYTLGLPVLDELGFKGTFFIVPGLTPDTVEEAKQVKSGEWAGVSWAEWKRAAANGHEIGNHSLRHMNLSKLKDAALRESINKSQDLIEEHLKLTPLTFCYPFHKRNDKVKAVVEPRFPFRREYQEKFGGDMDAKTLNSWIDEAIKNNQWAVGMIHGIETGFAHFKDPEQLFQHWRYVKTIESDIWVDTFAAIGSYKAVSESVKLETKTSENQVICNFKTVNETKIRSEKPLTIVIIAKGAKSANATQGAKSLPIKILPEKILVDVHPDNQPITVSWE